MRHIELNNELMQRGEDGFFRLEKDLEAVEAFMEHVRGKSLEFASVREQVSYLIDNDYYEDVYAQYAEADVEEVFGAARSVPFRFSSYMAASKFYTDYAMKSDDHARFLEHYPDRVAMVALFLQNRHVSRQTRGDNAIIIG